MFSENWLIFQSQFVNRDSLNTVNIPLIVTFHLRNIDEVWLKSKVIIWEMYFVKIFRQTLQLCKFF